MDLEGDYDRSHVMFISSVAKRVSNARTTYHIFHMDVEGDYDIVSYSFYLYPLPKITYLSLSEE